MLSRFSHVWFFCHPMDCTPLGSSIQAILQARTLEWAAISSPGYLPDPGIKLVFPVSLAWQAEFLTEPSEKHLTTSVQFCGSVVSDSLQPHGLKHRLSCPSPTLGACSNSCPSSWWCHPTISFSVGHFSSCLQSFPASGSFVRSQFFVRWPKYWSFSFSISPFNEHPGLISFRMDWLDLLAVQRTLKSLLQHHSSRESILCCSTFFIVQLSHPHMTTGKAIALIIQTLSAK